MTPKDIDLITIGRASADLYGAQTGGRLEDMGSFNKYIGGSPANIAAGAARLGLKSALITRVGDEHMGRFIREELVREGVDVTGVVTDPDRLTALVLLGIRDQKQFPLIFYRENCADMALCEDDIDPAFIARARCVTATGTHLSRPQTEAAVMKAVRLARENGALTALDIDYRPNLWGAAGHGEGESRYVESRAVTGKLRAAFGSFDLIVGTEEEFHIAGGTEDTIAALRAVREVSGAVLVCKRGAYGAAAFTGAVPDTLDEGQSGPSFPIEVFNVLGAGDGFMAGLLRGRLGDEDWPTALTWANACGALAVSRHGCAPSYPSWDELCFFLKRGVKNPAVRFDAEIEQIHWSTNRRGAWPELRVFAFDRCGPFEESEVTAPERISAFKNLCLEAALQAADGRDGYGILCDGRFGREALWRAAGSGLWTGRPVELPGSRPAALEPDIGPDLGGLSEWPLAHVVKAPCVCRPDDDEDTRTRQMDALRVVFAAARSRRLEFLLEMTAPEAAPAVIEDIYAAGIYPDWWQLGPFKTDAEWRAVCAAVTAHDPHTRGILAQEPEGPDASADGLAADFALAARHGLVKGFTAGRAVFGETAKAWFTGAIDDDGAIAKIAASYANLCRVWDDARAAG